MRGFDTRISQAEVIATAVKSLTAKGYKIKQLAKGYDGPNQKAMVAYSAKKNISLIVIFMPSGTSIQPGSAVRTQSYVGSIQYSVN